MSGVHGALAAAGAAAQDALTNGPAQASAAFGDILLLDVVLLAFLAVVALGIILTRQLFTVVMLSGAYSLLSAAFFVTLDAVDVAFTEAAVGAGISTTLMLAAMLLTAREARKTRAAQRWAAFIVTTVVGVVLLYATVDMPVFGDPEAPANAYVGRAYLVRTPDEVGPPNVVTAVLASYRGFDTLGETFVIFTAGLGVMLLLGLRGADLRAGTRAPIAPSAAPTDGHIVLRVVTKSLIPLIVLFALYVQFHGDFGPGGGFQAGAIMAVAILLHGLIFGFDATRQAVPPSVVRFVAACGVTLYTGVGFATLLMGEKFLDYDAFGHGAHGQHLGILLVELGVLLTVAGVMAAIFYAFAGRRPDIPEDQW